MIWLVYSRTGYDQHLLKNNHSFTDLVMISELQAQWQWVMRHIHKDKVQHNDSVDQFYF